MTNSDLLKFYSGQYELEVRGVRFWTPYFINMPKAFGPAKAPNMPGPYLGKGTPAQLRAALQRHLESTGQQVTDGEGYRRFMIDHGLGIECSGFIYFVLDNFLRRRGLGSLQRYLYWSRAELLDAYDEGVPWHQKDLPRLTVSAYPEWISLAKVKSDWGWKTPRKLVDVKRLVHEQACEVFDDVSRLRAGDMVYMKGHDEIAHAVVIVKVDGDRIEYAHSTGTNVGPQSFGGVEYGEIEVTDIKQSIDKQNWQDQQILRTHSFSPGALRRLTVLDG